MKLYNLYEEVILEDITANVGDNHNHVVKPTDSDIIDAIDGKYAVLINYEGEGGNRATGPRLIVPFALGVMTSGNKVIRAYQEDGESKTKANAWKLFRIDRINGWEPWKEYKNGQAPDGYNPNWDKTMAWVQHKAKY